jgi:hypothetical protein
MDEIAALDAESAEGAGGKGFSLSNLRSMRQFYVQNQDRIGQSMSDEFNAPAIGQSMTGQLAILQTASGKSGSSPIRQSLTGESGNPALRPFTLSWTHYVFLLRVKDPNERSFYEIEAAEQNWTVRELKRQFDSGLYERLALQPGQRGHSQARAGRANRWAAGRPAEGTAGSGVPRPG